MPFLHCPVVKPTFTIIIQAAGGEESNPRFAEDPMAVEAITSSASPTGVTGAIRSAANATGTSFDYLLATAQIESGLRPAIKAPNSTATGLFQFIDQTWLGTMKESGTALGYGNYADAISRTRSGRYVVRDPAIRTQILNLRKDPTANALLAGAFTQSNSDRLTARLGRAPTEGELYIAHFLGAGGAAKLITAAANQPNAKAASLFPRGAAANRAIFYGQGGQARSAGQVYGALVGKLDAARPPTTATRMARALEATSMTAAAPVKTAAVVAEAAAATATATPTSATPNSTTVTRAPDAARVTMVRTVPVQAYSAVSRTQVRIEPLAAIDAALKPESSVPSTPDAPVRAASAPDSGRAMFHGLYRDEESPAVSALVSELWGTRAAPAAVDADSATPAFARPATPPANSRARAARS
jgi:hypothetical protein